jgi:hypothetical protein
MIFVPTPNFFVDEREDEGKTYVFNDDEQPMPEELERRFLELGGYLGEAFIFPDDNNDRLSLCWIFDYILEYSGIETKIKEFEKERGEKLIILDDEEKRKLPFDSFTSRILKNIDLRKNILEQEYDEFRFYGTYEEMQTEKRALYRAANRHSDISWWKDYNQKQLLEEWKEEKLRENEFADKKFEAEKLTSGLFIGCKVKVKKVLKGVRTIPVPIDTVGIIREEHGLYWIVEFPLPLTDMNGDTWTLSFDKELISVGFISSELEKI